MPGRQGADSFDRVEKGEEIVIARNGRPVARLVPLETSVPSRAEILGSLTGLIDVDGDWDSAETNAEVAELFLGGPIAPDHV